MLAILALLEDVNFTDQTVCRPGIQLDYNSEVFSINSHKTSSSWSNNSKICTFWNLNSNFANILSLNPEIWILYSLDKQHVCGKQKMVLVVPLQNCQSILQTRNQTKITKKKNA